MKCRTCNVDMLEGIGLRERYTSGAPDFPGDDDGQTFYPSGRSNMVNVLKCPECGHSVEN